MGMTVLYRWPDDGRQCGTVARLCLQPPTTGRLRRCAAWRARSSTPPPTDPAGCFLAGRGRGCGPGPSPPGPPTPNLSLEGGSSQPNCIGPKTCNGKYAEICRFIYKVCRSLYIPYFSLRVPTLLVIGLTRSETIISPDYQWFVKEDYHFGSSGICAVLPVRLVYSNRQQPARAEIGKYAIEFDRETQLSIGSRYSEFKL